MQRELIALRCAVCLFMSRSERQYVSMLFAGEGEGGGMGTERGQSTEESKKTSTQRAHEPGGTRFLYHTWYLLLYSALV